MSVKYKNGLFHATTFATMGVARKAKKQVKRFTIPE